MTLSDLSSIGSFVSGIAVVVTLIFLLLQMRQSNQNQRALMQQGRSARVVSTILVGAEPSMSATMSRAYAADLEMDATQVRSMNAYATAFFWNVEDSFLQHRSGLLDSSAWEVDLATLRVSLSSPALRVGWKMARAQSSGEYRAFVDGLLDEVKPRKSFNELAVWKDLMAKEQAQAV